MSLSPRRIQLAISIPYFYVSFSLNASDRSRHCFPVRPSRHDPTRLHFLVPYFFTSSITLKSSSFVHGRRSSLFFLSAAAAAAATALALAILAPFVDGFGTAAAAVAATAAIFVGVVAATGVAIVDAWCANTGIGYAGVAVAVAVVVAGVAPFAAAENVAM